MLAWWHWIILGLCLSLAELAVPAFFIIWFGIGALAVGLTLLFLPELAASSQILLWTAFSVILVVFWFRYLKPRTVSAIGTSSAQVLGEVGILVSDLCPNSRGQVRFQKPVLGADTWECYADTQIKAGKRVRIIGIEGNFIKVEEATCSK